MSTCCAVPRRRDRDRHRQPGRGRSLPACRYPRERDRGEL